jgi:hypothetical protein
LDALAEIGLQLFIDLFCARTDAYVRDSRAHIPEPLTVDLLVDAYTNKYAVSGYTANGGLTHVGALDFDHCDPAQIMAVRDTMKRVGVPTLLSESRRGDHLWVFVGPGDGKRGSIEYGDVPATMVHKALEQCVRLTDPDLLTDLDIFPKHTSSPFGVGALRLPLMTHPKSHERYPCYDMEGTRLTKIVDLVTAANGLTTPWAVIAKLAKDAPVEYPRGLGEYRRSISRTPGSPASALLQSIGATNAQPGRSVRCPFHEDSHASMSIADDDERVWCKAPECVAYNGGRGVGSLALAKMIEKRA